MLLLPLLHRAMKWSLAPLGARAAITRVQGRNVHFFDIPGRGAAPDAVLLHGLGGAAGGWLPVVPGLLREHRRVLIPDLPGFGLSPLGKGERPADAGEMLAVVHDFVRDQVRGPAVLVGNSLGGALAATVALLREELVAGLGLLSPAGAPLTGAQIVALRAAFGGGAKEMLRRIFHRPPLAARLLARDLAEYWASEPVMHLLDTLSPDVHLAPEGLERLRVPVVLLWGASERVIPFEGLHFFRAHLPPHARIEVLERCGHVAQIEQPRVVVDRLSWLARQTLHPRVVGLANAAA